MTNEVQTQHHHHESFLRSKAGLVMLGFLAIGGVLLFTEHRAHVLGVLPYLLLLACPLMHVFMHGGHGHNHDAQSPANESPTKAGTRQ